MGSRRDIVQTDRLGLVLFDLVLVNALVSNDSTDYILPMKPHVFMPMVCRRGIFSTAGTGGRVRSVSGADADVR